MGLIYFHIFLMLTGMAFFFFFGMWELNNYMEMSKTFDLVTGLASFVFSTGLLCYLVWFIRKKKPFMK